MPGIQILKDQSLGGHQCFQKVWLSGAEVPCSSKAQEPRVTEGPRTMPVPGRMSEYSSIPSFLIIRPLCSSSELLKL